MASLPDDYQSMTGADKLDLLWQRVSEHPYTDDRLPMRVPGVLTRRKLFSVDYNRVSFEHDGDEVPARRRKIIHGYGAAALVRLDVTEEHPYTGIFASGGRGLVRISDATGGRVFGPSVAIKFPVDGQPSINLFANEAEHGPARDFDIFNRYYSNSLPSARKFDTKLVARSFQKTAIALGGARLYSNYLSLHEPAGQNLDGSSVAEPVVPDRIEFHPTGDIHLDAGLKPDWRAELREVPVDTTLFEVRISGSIDESAVPYGRLILEERFVASRYGDEQLFFQHHIGPRT